MSNRCPRVVHHSANSRPTLVQRSSKTRPTLVQRYPALFNCRPTLSNLARPGVQRCLITVARCRNRLSTNKVPLCTNNVPLVVPRCCPKNAQLGNNWTTIGRHLDDFGQQLDDNWTTIGRQLDAIGQLWTTFRQQLDSFGQRLDNIWTINVVHHCPHVVEMLFKRHTKVVQK